MKGLDSNHLEQLGSVATRARSSIMRRSRLKGPLTVLCGLFLVCYLGFTVHNIHRGEAASLGPSWGGLAESTLALGRSKSSSKQPSMAVPVVPHELDSFMTGVRKVVHDEEEQYREIFAMTPMNRKYMPINFNTVPVTDPMIIPHPLEYDMWIILARRLPEPGAAEEQQQSEGGEHESSLRRRSDRTLGEQVICPAARWNGNDGWLDCISDLGPLPRPTVVEDACGGRNEARLFYSPNAPFVTFGPDVEGSCDGTWTQDARSSLTGFRYQQFLGSQDFHNATRLRRLQRLTPADPKSFYFWDSKGDMFVQRSLFPHRVFAKVYPDGEVGDDLAQAARHLDQVCYGKYMPRIDPEKEVLEQATNSLSITLCRRENPKCIALDRNTFIMSIFHVRSRTNEKIYKPYVVLYRRDKPYTVHAVATRPLWVYGRPDTYSITSMSWKKHTQKYHGYIDDPLFLGLTVGDSLSGTIDVPAGDLLQDLGLC